jgi:hypothetical protein
MNGYKFHLGLGLTGVISSLLTAFRAYPHGTAGPAALCVCFSLGVRPSAPLSVSENLDPDQ